MKTKATDNFMYRGKHINPGDPVDVDPADMEKLVKLGKIAGQVGGKVESEILGTRPDLIIHDEIQEKPKKPQKRSKKKYY